MREACTSRAPRDDDFSLLLLRFSGSHGVTGIRLRAQVIARERERERVHRGARELIRITDCSDL